MSFTSSTRHSPSKTLAAGNAAALDALPKRQAQPRSRRTWLQQWQWVAEGEPTDCSWLHFALYSALQQLVCPGWSQGVS